MKPLIIAGGPCAYNPEPLSDFVDVFLIGDGEELFALLPKGIQEIPREGRKQERISKINS